MCDACRHHPFLPLCVAADGGGCVGVPRCRIIDPIASRCAKFRFKPLANVAMRTRLEHIAEAEGLTVSDQVRLCVACVSLSTEMGSVLVFDLEPCHRATRRC